MMIIEKIWQDLENERCLYSGLLYKRYSSKIQPDIYVALKLPERLRCIAAHLNASFDLPSIKRQKFRDIKIETLSDEKDHEKKFLLIILLNNQHKEIFSVLCEDLLNHVKDFIDENELYKYLLQRLEKWRSLFEKLSQKGLSDETQRGLYGELCFLKKFISHTDDLELCVSSWKGTEKSIQDFQFGDWAVEVKTTHGKNQQKLQISSERQLDTAFVHRIYLYHFSLDIRHNRGETLNDIINKICDILSVNPIAYNIFRIKLLEANYFDIHKDLYNESGYSIRRENIYRVTEDFPRITESQVPPGVGDVRYSIVISANENWTLNDKILFKEILIN